MTERLDPKPSEMSLMFFNKTFFCIPRAHGFFPIGLRFQLTQNRLFMKKKKLNDGRGDPSPKIVENIYTFIKINNFFV